MNANSGKQLCDVPFDDIFVGMEVIYTTGGGGLNGEVISKTEKPPFFDDNVLTIKFENGKVSYNEHCMFDLVRVK